MKCDIANRVQMPSAMVVTWLPYSRELHNILAPLEHSTCLSEELIVPTCVFETDQSFFSASFLAYVLDIGALCSAAMKRA